MRRLAAAPAIVQVDRLVCAQVPSPGVSFSVAEGERLFLCGPAASGLLLALGGFAKTVSGSISYDGRGLAGLPVPLRHVAYIPAGDSLLGRRSLLDNVMLAGVRRELATAALARLGLRADARHPARTLPAPERRLAALARALASAPGLLLIEEGAGDPSAIIEALAAIREPAIVACAAAALALAHADRILLLRGGVVEQLATPRDLYERPASGFAASWFGACNLIPAIIGGPGVIPGSAVAWVAGCAMPSRQRLPAPEPALLAIRPHRLVLAMEGVPARVAAIRYHGVTTRVVLETACGPLMLDAADPPPLALGDERRVSWNWSDAWPVVAEKVS